MQDARARRGGRGAGRGDENEMNVYKQTLHHSPLASRERRSRPRPISSGRSRISINFASNECRNDCYRRAITMGQGKPRKRVSLRYEFLEATSASGLLRISVIRNIGLSIRNSMPDASIDPPVPSHANDAAATSSSTGPRERRTR